MITKEIVLKINIWTLGILAVVDVVRGFMHTYSINWAAENIAKIDATPDSLILMGTFGMSNFLTAFIYALVVWKAKFLSPIILFLIPTSYFIGIFGLRLQGIQMESEFNGQYIMYTYFALCLISSLLYFLTPKSAS